MVDLTYINGVIKSKSTELIDLKQVEQFNNLSKEMLISSLESMQIFKKELQRDDAFLQDEIELKAFLSTLYPKDHLIFKVFYLSSDHMVLANTFKKHLLNIAVDTVNPLSNMTLEDIESVIFDEESMQPLKILYQSLENKSSKEISDRIFQYLLKVIQKDRQFQKDDSIKLYVSQWIDQANLLLFFRYKVFKLPFDDFYTLLLDGGTIRQEFFESIEKADLKDAYQALNKQYDLRQFEATQKLDDHAFLAILAKDLLTNLLKLIETFTYQLDGLSPTIEYILRRRQIMQMIKEIYYKKERE